LFSYFSSEKTFVASWRKMILPNEKQFILLRLLHFTRQLF
jgi:hypothetical protein